MGWAYEIDIVAAAFFEAQHYAGKFTGCHFPAFIQLAEAVVLAVGAFHVAPGEEYSPRAAFSRNRRFLSLV